MIDVMVEEHSTFGDDEPSRRKIGEYATRAEAIAAAEARLDQGLHELLTPQITAAELFQQWTLFGEDVYLAPNDGPPPFDAYEYARRRSRELSAAG
jgi:hypothetical protein